MAIASNNIFGEYEKSVQAATGGTNRIANDKDTFLKLLIAQLTHQDPLNPAEDKEFIAQLAQFTSVEELQKVNKGISELSKAQDQQQIINAASLINLHVMAKGDTITKVKTKDADGNPADHIGFMIADFTEAASTCTINVYATDEKGNPTYLVRSEKGTMPAGEQRIEWDGKDNTGKDMPYGTYVMTVSAKRADGSEFMVETRSQGIVVGVETQADGNHKLFLGDGRSVGFNDVKTISYPVQQAKPDDNNKGDGGNENDDGNKGDGENGKGDGEGEKK